MQKSSRKKNSQTISDLKKRCIELGIKTQFKDGKDEIQKLLMSYEELEEKKVVDLQKQGAAIGLCISPNMNKPLLIQSIVNANKLREDIAHMCSMSEIQTQLGKYFLSSTGKKEVLVDRLYQRELITLNSELVKLMENGKKEKEFDKIMTMQEEKEESKTHSYKTEPIIMRLENGYTFEAQVVSIADINISDYIT